MTASQKDSQLDTQTASQLDTQTASQLDTQTASQLDTQTALPAVVIPNFLAGVDGLLPAIAQDEATGRVLMMAWMNREAWEETLRTGEACYYSRSRRSLWRKGETSGHRQRVVKVQVDCDADCILMQVRQVGAACHEGYASCFFRTVHPDLSIGVEEPRLVDPQVVYRQ